MSRFLLFGATTPSGAAFMERVGTCSLLVAGRTRPKLPQGAKFQNCDLIAPVDEFISALPKTPTIVVSFAPIWHLAPFIARIGQQEPSYLRHWRAIIACSSSSVVTKRFATNPFDRMLVTKLRQAEQLLANFCREHLIHCRILAPTLIYGSWAGYSDRNLSILRRILLTLPILPLPANTGERQPIHCRQLADVAWSVAECILSYPHATPTTEHLLVGGDDTISYMEMLRRLRDSDGVSTPRQGSAQARGCKFLPLPNRLFHALASPIVLISPKMFEAILRISADLSGFQQAHEFTSMEPLPFPVHPLFP